MQDEVRRPCRRSKRGARRRPGAQPQSRGPPKGGAGERTQTVRSQRHGQPGLHRSRGSRDAPTGPQGGALEGTVPSEQGAAAGGEERGFRCDGRRRCGLKPQLHAAKELAPAAAAVNGGSPNPKQADGKMPHFTHAG